MLYVGSKTQSKQACAVAISHLQTTWYIIEVQGLQQHLRGSKGHLQIHLYAVYYAEISYQAYKLTFAIHFSLVNVYLVVFYLMWMFRFFPEEEHRACDLESKFVCNSRPQKKLGSIVSTRRDSWYTSAALLLTGHTIPLLCSNLYSAYGCVG